MLSYSVQEAVEHENSDVCGHCFLGRSINEKEPLFNKGHILNVWGRKSKSKEGLNLPPPLLNRRQLFT